MKHLRLIEIGKHLSSRDRARRLREQLVREIRGDECRAIVDLAGVRSVSHSFADEFFAVLVAERGADWFRRCIQFANASPGVRTAVLEAIVARIDGHAPGDHEPVLPPPPSELVQQSIEQR